MTVPCAQRFLQHGGLSLAYEVARLALNSLRPPGTAPAPTPTPAPAPGGGSGAVSSSSAADSVVEEEEEQSKSSLPPPEAELPGREQGAEVLSEAQRAAARLRHRVLMSALLLALLVFKYGVKPHEASAER